MPVDRDAEIAHRILAHYDKTARMLPWRNPPGAPLPLGDPDWPYRVWLSEIMLQQTTVTAVKPYFATFIARWPSVAALAEADDAEVMSAWAGLGYYARARNLLVCARTVVHDHNGRFPSTEAELRSLPGVGRYTASAIAAIAFGHRAVVIDGNVERVTARLFAEPCKTKLPPVVARLTPSRAGDFAQAMMDMGSAICTPRSPKCNACPVNDFCLGKATAEAFPTKKPKPEKAQRNGTAWWVERDGEVLLVRRPAKGLLGGMLGLPTSEWTETRLPVEDALCTITHVFTHFALTLDVRALDASEASALASAPVWWPIAQIDDAGLPTVFNKAVLAARAARKETA